MACRESLSESLVGVVLNRPVDLVGALSDCLVGVFWWQEAFLKDVSYESLVGELFLEESLVGSCRTLFLAHFFFQCNIVACLAEMLQHPFE